MRKILIIKLSAVGDVFIALRHIDAICSHHNEDEVWVLTTPLFKNLFDNHPKLKLILLDRSKTFSSEGTLSRIFWVRGNRFDSIYDLQGNRTSRRLVRYSKAPIRVGSNSKSVYNRYPDNFYSRTSQINVFDQLNEVLACAGLPDAKKDCKLYPSKKDIDYISKWKEDNSINDGKYVLIHAGSSFDWPSKRWPGEYFLKTAFFLEKNKNLKCVWVGGKEDQEINADLSSKAGINATSQFSIIQLYLLGKNARFAIANDSGPMHILAASGVPVYSFFGPTNWMRSHAIGNKERVFQKNLECSPCFNKKCPPKYKHACLTGIEPEIVINKIIEDLGI